MKINKICCSLIKPVTPTPPNLKNYEISFWDSCQSPAPIAVVLFYESKPESESESESDSDRHLKLEETLAETLVQFYPLAGRFIKKLNSVDCSDQGAEFLRAEAPDLDLASVIGTDPHNHLIPDHYFRYVESDDQPLLSIQATRFACGGITVAVSVTHRVFDVSSLATFVVACSSTAARPEKTIVTPLFNLPSLFPTKNRNSVTYYQQEASTARAPVKKLDFDKATIQTLRSKIGKQVSAARAASAALAKALILLDAAKRGGGTCRGFRIFQPVNMRERASPLTAVPVVAKHACGNFSFISLSRRVEASAAGMIGIPELSDLIGEAARRCIAEHAGIASADGDGRDIMIARNRDEIAGAIAEQETNHIVFIDWSKFGFYEADFGWGKPAWASGAPNITSHNYVELMSNKEGDGIEAWLRFNAAAADIDVHQDWEFINQVIHSISN